MAKRKAIIVGDAVYIPLTQGKLAIVDLVDAELGDFTWTAARRPTTWYAYRQPRGAMIYLHHAVARRTGLAIAGIEVDHRDGDGLNCRRENLRPATHGQNQFNSRRRRTNKSGFKGVHKQAGCARWSANICVAGTRHYLGLFRSPEEAFVAYTRAAARLHGAFAPDLNIVGEDRPTTPVATAGS